MDRDTVCRSGHVRCRILRITNLRANTTTGLAGGPPGISEITASISTNVPVSAPSSLVAFATQGLSFSSALSSPSTVSLNFQENFADAFRPRITAPNGPFSMSAAGPTRRSLLYREPVHALLFREQLLLAARIDNWVRKHGNAPPSAAERLGAKAAFLSVPNQISDGIGAEAYLIVNGRPVTSTGNTSLPVTKGTLEVLYEVTAGNAVAIDLLTITGTLLDASGATLSFPPQAVFSGQLAPIDNTGTASPTAPEPRFISQGS